MLKGYVIDGDRVTVSKESFLELENNVREIKNEIAEIKEKTFIEPIKQRLFYDGQYFDAYDFICSLIFGANAVVASDIPPYSVVVGNPAKVIRKRFDDEMIGLLEKLEWWNLPINKIQKIIPLLSNSDIGYVKEEIKHYIDGDSHL